MTEIDTAVADSNASSATILATIFNKSSRTIAAGGAVNLAGAFMTANYADATFGSIAPGGKRHSLSIGIWSQTVSIPHIRRLPAIPLERKMAGPAGAEPVKIQKESQESDSPYMTLTGHS